MTYHRDQHTVQLVHWEWLCLVLTSWRRAKFLCGKENGILFEFDRRNDKFCVVADRICSLLLGFVFWRPNELTYNLWPISVSESPTFIKEFCSTCLKGLSLSLFKLWNDRKNSKIRNVKCNWRTLQVIEFFCWFIIDFPPITFHLANSILKILFV